MIEIREAGGYGDIICMGAAALAVKAEWPTERVVLAVPEEFVATASRLAGVDWVLSLGPLSKITPIRRPRDGAFNVKAQPYLLKALMEVEPGEQVVSLFCPGYLYESSCPGILRYNRTMLFAAAAGVRHIRQARPIWQSTMMDRGAARDFFDKSLPLERRNCSKPLLAYQPRSTCAARSIPQEVSNDLMRRLAQRFTVLYFDCVPPRDLPPEVVPVVGHSFEVAAAIFAACQAALVIDSAFLHLAAAMDKPCLGIFGPTDGRNIVQTYPTCQVLDGHDAHCVLPCNYNPGKGWDKKCRATGCRRMDKHSALVLEEKALALFGDIA